MGRTKKHLAQCLASLSFSDVSAVLDNYFAKRTVEEIIPLMEKYSVEIPRTSLFIAFEGIGGSGKSTLIDAFAAKIATSEHKSIEKIKDSTLGDFSEAIRLYREKGGPACKDPLIIAHMLAAKRRQVLASGTLAQKLQDHDIVISNRYDKTTFAYQLAEGVTPYQVLMTLAGSSIVPDMTVFVYCDPEIANKRKFPKSEDAGRVDFKKAALINSNFERISSVQSHSYGVITTNPEVLQKGSPELEAIIKPMVEELYKGYLTLPKTCKK